MGKVLISLRSRGRIAHRLIADHARTASAKPLIDKVGRKELLVPRNAVRTIGAARRPRVTIPTSLPGAVAALASRPMRRFVAKPSDAQLWASRSVPCYNVGFRYVCRHISTQMNQPVIVLLGARTLVAMKPIRFVLEKLMLQHTALSASHNA